MASSTLSPFQRFQQANALAQAVYDASPKTPEDEIKYFESISFNQQLFADQSATVTLGTRLTAVAANPTLLPKQKAAKNDEAKQLHEQANAAITAAQATSPEVGRALMKVLLIVHMIPGGEQHRRYCLHLWRTGSKNTR